MASSVFRPNSHGMCLARLDQLLVDKLRPRPVSLASVDKVCVCVSACWTSRSPEHMDIPVRRDITRGHGTEPFVWDVPC